MTSSPLTIATYFIAILLYCSSSGAISAQPSGTKTFSVGIVPQFDSRKIHKIWRPILKRTRKNNRIQIQTTGCTDHSRV